MKNEEDMFSTEHPDIEKYIGHNQFKKWNSESDLIKN